VAARLHPNDHVRVIRALERLREGAGAAGEGLPAGAGLWRPSPRFEALHVGLTMERTALARVLHARAARMVAGGLLDEVRALLARGHDPTLPALQSIGYREFVEVACGQATAAEALGRMQRETVRYAKRQWTWFAREPGIEWVDVALAGGAPGVAALVERRLRAGGIIG
jgi:tRNA dimethylallyltransferase